MKPIYMIIIKLGDKSVYLSSGRNATPFATTNLGSAKAQLTRLINRNKEAYIIKTTVFEVISYDR